MDIALGYENAQVREKLGVVTVLEKVPIINGEWLPGVSLGVPRSVARPSTGSVCQVSAQWGA
jgi:hypothetical protein